MIRHQKKNVGKYLITYHLLFPKMMSPILLWRVHLIQQMSGCLGLEQTGCSTEGFPWRLWLRTSMDSNKTELRSSSYHKRPLGPQIRDIHPIRSTDPPLLIHSPRRPKRFRLNGTASIFKKQIVRHTLWRLKGKASTTISTNIILNTVCFPMCLPLLKVYRTSSVKLLIHRAKSSCEVQAQKKQSNLELVIAILHRQGFIFWGMSSISFLPISSASIPSSPYIKKHSHRSLARSNTWSDSK